MKRIHALSKFGDRLAEIYLSLALVFMIVLIFATFMQVFTRYVLNSAWPWTEELARYAFIWMNLTGAAGGLRKGSLVAVDFLPKKLTGMRKTVLMLLIYALILVCALVLAVYGAQLIMTVGASPSVVMRIPMVCVHSAMPVGGVGMALITVVLAAETIGESRPVEGGAANG